MRNDFADPLTWRKIGSIEIATDLSRVFKIDTTEGVVRLSLSDQLEEYPLGNWPSIEEAKRVAMEKKLELMMHDRSQPRTRHTY